MPLSKMAAGVFGAVYLAVGVLGFIAGSATLSTGNLLGLFPVNAVHNVVHMGVGAAGLAAYFGGVSTSRMFARVVGVTYAVLAILGIAIANPLGLVPIGGLDIGLHAVTAIALLYVGFASPSRELTTA